MDKLTIYTLILQEHSIEFGIMFCCTSWAIIDWTKKQLNCWIHIFQNVIILLGIMEFGQFISTSDMQQGSNLGPLLLISFINHLLEMVLLFVLLSFLEKFRFADDLKLFSFIKNFVDCVNLQVHLMLTLSTCERNKLRLNMDKFRIMNFFRKTEIYSYDYDCNGRKLYRHIVLRGLGVLFDTELSFVELISQMVLDATGVYGFMVRNCSDFTEVNCFKISYNRVLGNASVVWSPVYECHCRKLKGFKEDLWSSFWLILMECIRSKDVTMQCYVKEQGIQVWKLEE